MRWVWRRVIFPAYAILWLGLLVGQILGPDEEPGWLRPAFLFASGLWIVGDFRFRDDPTEVTTPEQV